MRRSAAESIRCWCACSSRMVDNDGRRIRVGDGPRLKRPACRDQHLDSPLAATATTTSDTLHECNKSTMGRGMEVTLTRAAEAITHSTLNSTTEKPLRDARTIGTLYLGLVLHGEMTSNAAMQCNSTLTPSFPCLDLTRPPPSSPMMSPPRSQNIQTESQHARS